ncbi:hypothetical protein LZ554_009087 [Drepanopeziza brunnea f. sp. 'monogermtubi']|nr:hypothetical protein LZ554_009087 [Drepanopeziza brunnea f. sp. 'monogermtubi']
MVPCRSAPTSKKLAVIGPLANATEEMQGNYFAIAPYLRSPLWAANEAGGFEVTYVKGVNISNGTDIQQAEALEAANQADVIVFAGGLDITIEAESRMGTGLDSTPLTGVDAHIWAGYPGQDGGVAIFNILTGKVASMRRNFELNNPGRL